MAPAGLASMLSPGNENTAGMWQPPSLDYHLLREKHLNSSPQGCGTWVLTILLFGTWAVAGALTGTSRMSGNLPPAQQAATAGALLAVCLLDSSVFAYVVVRSRVTGWRLAALVFLAYFGITGVMTLVEAQVYMPHMLPKGMLPHLYANSALIGILLSVLSVTVFGRWRRQSGTVEAVKATLTGRGWTVRLALAATAYVVLYYSFGYCIAWQSPAVREYYSAVKIPAWAPLLQVVRALLWTAIAYPVVRTMKGRWWEGALATGLLFAVIMTNAPHLLPNPFMPRPAQMAHLVETASSNFIFGWVVAWLLRPSASKAASASLKP